MNIFIELDLENYIKEGEGKDLQLQFDQKLKL